VAEDNNNVLAEEQPESVSGPGERLRAAREAQGRNIEDVAHNLHLELSVVKAIESDQLDGLGAPVFVRGYLRSYARLLGLPEQELADAWVPVEQDPEDFRSLSMQTEVKTGASLSMFVLWVMLALLVLGALIYLLSGDDEAKPEATLDTPASAPVSALPARESEFVVEERGFSELSGETASEVSAREAPDTDFVVVPEVQAEADIVGPVATPEPEVAAPSAAETPDEYELVLSFSNECWVEVSDATRRLLYGLEKAGSVRTFSAKPPLRFFVGDVDAVTIRLSGSEYAVPDNVRTGRNTARFVLNAEDMEGVQ